MLARFCPTVFFVEVLLDLASAVASSLRQRRVLEHMVEPPLVLALELQLELTLRFPTWVRAVAQICLALLCWGQLDFAVGCQDQFRYGIPQAPACVRLSQSPHVACRPDIATPKVGSS